MSTTAWPSTRSFFSLFSYISFISFVLLYNLQTTLAAPPFPWGVRIRDGAQTIEIPSVASTGSNVGCMTVLPPTASAKRGTLVCRIGSAWKPKRPGPAIDPKDTDGDGLLFVNLATAQHSRYGGLQPAPYFVVQSPDSRYLAFGSSVGWSFTERSRQDLLKPSGNDRFHSSGLTAADVKGGLQSMLVGTVLFSIWETAPLRPIWEMRYPNDQDPKLTRFRRPWDTTNQLVVPWWAFNEEPLFYLYPVMGFSPDSRFLVTLCDDFGVWVLDVQNGHQFMVSPTTKACRPITFVFTDEKTMLIFRSDGTAQKMQIADGHVLDTIDMRSKPDLYPGVSENTGYYPLFCPDSSHRWTAIMNEKRLILRDDFRAASIILDAEVSVGAMALGVSRFEISRNGQYAGVHFRTASETIEHLRFRDIGFDERYERLNLSTGRVVERIAVVTDDNRPLYQDGVLTTEVPWGPRIHAFGACLNSTGEGSVWMTPYLTRPQLSK